MMLRRVLVLCTGYPTRKNPYNCTWAHTRNKFYLQNGIDVDVLVLDGGDCYEIDGVDVISANTAKDNLRSKKYNLVLSHSPNIRRHLPFLQNFVDCPIILFVHGTESMSISRDYPEPYFFERPSFGRKIVRDAYDYLKFILLRRFIVKNKRRIHLIFVSEWMKGVFSKNVLNISNSNISYSVINNSLGEGFLTGRYRPEEPFKADFVTLRRLDFSKFSVDLVVEAAIANPSKLFHIYGTGRFFSFFKKPPNVEVFDYHLKAEEIPEILNSYRCALMPTRCDAQGVMVCEMAAYGMPVITSDIEISHEMFDGILNVKTIDLSEFSQTIDESFFDLADHGAAAKEKFDLKNNLHEELRVMEFCMRTMR